LAKTDFHTHFGLIPTVALTIIVKDSNGPSTATGGGDTITIYARHPGWAGGSTTRRLKIVIHEYFHVFQSFVGWPSPPVWFLEGAAEYMGWHVQVDSGLVSNDFAKECNTRTYFNFSLPGLLDLEDNRFYSAPGDGNVYSMVYLAVDFLVVNHGLVGFRSYWQAPGAWPSRFTTAFGISPQDFYDAFEGYRRTLRQIPFDPPVNDAPRGQRRTKTLTQLAFFQSGRLFR